MRTVEWIDGRVRMIDQRRLPLELVVVEFDDYRDVAQAIQDMTIRGAPAIGAAAAFGLALAAQHSRATGRDGLLADLEVAAQTIGATRPTAVNLSWAVKRMMRAAQAAEPGEIVPALIAEAAAHRRRGRRRSTAAWAPTARR